MAVSKRDILLKGKEKQRHRYDRLVFIWFIIFLIFLVEIILLLRAPKFLLTEVRVTGASSYEQVKIKEAIGLALVEKCPCLIPRASIFLYSKKQLAKIAQGASSRVGYITFKRQGQILIVDVAERQPVALWCQGRHDDRDCFFLDQTGTIVSTAPIFSHSSMVEFYSASSSARLYEKPLGDFSLATSALLKNELLSIFQHDFRVPVSLKYIELVEKDDLIFYFVSSRDNWLVLISRSSDPKIVLANLKALLGSESFRRDLKISQHLKQIDLRFKQKVFYKFN